MRFAVLASGSGTNLAALLEAQSRGALAPAEISLVICNRPEAGALARAEQAGIESALINHRDFDSRESFEAALLTRLESASIGAVILAGFMRVLTPTFVNAFPERIVNTHPALCPSFPGTHAARQAIEHGVRVTGCTVHFVDSDVDTGPIIFQAPVELGADDDAASLQKRIQVEEHRLLPIAVRLLAQGRLRISGRRVAIADEQSSAD